MCWDEFMVALIWGGGIGLLISLVPVERMLRQLPQPNGRCGQRARGWVVVALNAGKGAVGFAWPGLVLAIACHDDGVECTLPNPPLWEALQPYVELVGISLVPNAVLVGQSVLFWRRWSDEPGTTLVFGVIALTLPTLLVPAVLYVVWLPLWLRRRTTNFALPITVATVGVALALAAGSVLGSLPFLCCAGVVAANVRQRERWRRATEG